MNQIWGAYSSLLSFQVIYVSFQTKLMDIQTCHEIFVFLFVVGLVIKTKWWSLAQLHHYFFKSKITYRVNFPIGCPIGWKLTDGQDPRFTLVSGTAEITQTISLSPVPVSLIALLVYFLSDIICWIIFELHWSKVV